MKKFLLSAIALLCLVTGFAQTRYDFSKLQMEKLGRGVIAVRQSSSEVFVSWRYLSSDPAKAAFNVYRDGVLLTPKPIKDVCWFVDNNPSSEAATYEVRPASGQLVAGSFTLPAKAPEGYLPIPIVAPAANTMPDGEVATYSANDCSIGDVDGDGEYEIFLKWDPSNAHDNAHAGYTSEVFIDCIKLSGELLWRVNLGKNIRAGAHYTQFLVYDFDGDGCAELVCKTSDGTIDGTGKVIGDKKADYRDHGKTNRALLGRIMIGNEYLTVFNGRTGAAMATVDYVPDRGPEGIWGDKTGNRSDRYLAAVAYLDGIHPSAVMCRGYYTRATLAAFNWDGKELKLHWLFDSNSSPELKKYEGQGNHNLRVADIDGDGCDEIIYGSCAIDHNGKGLYSNGYGHGDSMHLGAMFPGRDDLQVWIGHEGRGTGSTLVDAATGKLYWRIPSNTDVGRSFAADVDPTNPGWEMWSSASGSMRNYKGDKIADKPASQNFGVWWDGDLSRELLDGNHVDKFNPTTRKVDRMATFEGAKSINGSKSVPAISGDLYGDWREEVLLPSSDGRELRLYVSTIPTNYRFHTFLQDPVYRTSVANENICYNQPPEAGFYFGEELSGEFRGTKLKGKKAKPVAVLEDVLLDSVVFRSNRPAQQPQAQRPQGAPQQGQRPQMGPQGPQGQRPQMQGQAPQGQRPQGAPQQGQRPQMGPQGPQGQRPQMQGQVPQGQRPQGAPQQGQRPQMGPQGPQGQRPQGAPQGGQFAFGQMPRYSWPELLRHDMEDAQKPTDEDFAKTARPVAGSSRKGNNPVLFLIGDSTMRTGTRGNGDNGQWGWGYYAPRFFDQEKITVENHALGGLSSRTFYRGWWPDVIKGVQKGDFVIIQLGHNDSGAYDTPFGRSAIPGTSKETVEVKNEQAGTTEVVMSYGGYLRCFIDEVRAKGATPILFTLTARDQWEPDGSPRRKTETFDKWIYEIAAEKKVEVVDHEGIIAAKYAKYGPQKVAYQFYSDTIHTNAFGAEDNARSAAEGIAQSNSELKNYLLPLDLPKQEFKREAGKPAFIVVGDSTIQNTDSDPNGMWGWGSVLETVFDSSKITLVNAGKAGRSCRTFIEEGRWEKVYNAIEPGDYVAIQFGHNDMGPINAMPFRAELPGTGDGKRNYFMPHTRQYEAIYTYGWYLRKFIGDVREKGGIPILVSLTPRNEWPGGKMERRNDSYGLWCQEVVNMTDVDFVDMHNLSADYYDTIGPEATKAYYKNDHTHTSRMGAERNAKSLAEGLKKLNHPLAKYLK